MKKIVCLAVAALFGFAPAFDAAAVEMNSTLETVSTAKPKVQPKTVVFATHLHCKNCVKKVQENISFEKGVKDLKVDLEAQTITVTYDPSKTDEATLAKAINKLGYKAEAVVAK